MTTSPDVARAAQGQSDRAAMLEKLNRNKPRRGHYVKVLDETAVTELEDAKQELGFLKFRIDTGPAPQPDDPPMPMDPRLAIAEERVAAAEIAYADAVAVMSFEGLDRLAFSDLVGDHPPTSAEAKEAGASFETETFAPALCAACSLDGLTAEDFQATWDGDPKKGVKGWMQSEVNDCWNTALALCTNSRNAALPKGFGATAS